MEWYLKVLKNYAGFSGRARRQEYWMYFLINFIISIGLNLIGKFLLDTEIIGQLYGLAVLLPGLAVGVRRLHDVGKSGWFLLIALIPLIGAIWLIVVLATEGEAGTNEYGPDPKGNADVDEIEEFGQKEVDVNMEA